MRGCADPPPHAAVALLVLEQVLQRTRGVAKSDLPCQPIPIVVGQRTHHHLPTAATALAQHLYRKDSKDLTTAPMTSSKCRADRTCT